MQCERLTLLYILWYVQPGHLVIINSFWSKQWHQFDFTFIQIFNLYKPLWYGQRWIQIRSNLSDSTNQQNSISKSTEAEKSIIKAGKQFLFFTGCIQLISFINDIFFFHSFHLIMKFNNSKAFFSECDIQQNHMQRKKNIHGLSNEKCASILLVLENYTYRLGASVFIIRQKSLIYLKKYSH